jgi:hypothetical protein
LYVGFITSFHAYAFLLFCFTEFELSSVIAGNHNWGRPYQCRGLVGSR